MRERFHLYTLSILAYTLVINRQIQREMLKNKQRDLILCSCIKTNGESEVLLVKKDRRIDKSKNALKDALILLMEKKEFKTITITEIVHLADLNRGTFYKHYPTQEELLRELIEDVLSDLVHSYRDPYMTIPDFEVSKISVSSIKIFDHVKRYSRFYTIIIHSNVLPGFQNRICQVLKELIQSDLIQSMPNSEIDRSLLSSYNAYALFGLIIEWVNKGFAFTPIQMADQLISIISYQNPKNTLNIANQPNSMD